MLCRSQLFKNSLFCDTDKNKQTHKLNYPKLSICKKNKSQLESSSRALSFQAWGLEQLEIKLNPELRNLSKQNEQMDDNTKN